MVTVRNSMFNKNPIYFHSEFGIFDKDIYICSPLNKIKGSLAQLVQSICLTSRGSLVRTQQFPRNPFIGVFSFNAGVKGRCPPRRTNPAVPIKPLHRVFFICAECTQCISYTVIGSTNTMLAVPMTCTGG